MLGMHIPEGCILTIRPINYGVELNLQLKRRRSVSDFDGTHTDETVVWVNLSRNALPSQVQRALRLLEEKLKVKELEWRNRNA